MKLSAQPKPDCPLHELEQLIEQHINRLIIHAGDGTLYVNLHFIAQEVSDWCDTRPKDPT